ncbi:hypothetical protein [Promicromonospora soli]
MSNETTASDRPAVIDVAVLAALLPVLAAAVRLWIFSGGDAAVFRTLVRTLDIPAVLIGTGILIAPAVLVIFVIALLTDWRFRDSTVKWSNRNEWIRFVVPPLVFVVVFTVPLIHLVAALAALVIPSVAFVLIRRRWEWGKAILDKIVAPRGDTSGPDPWAMAVIFGIALLMSGTAMWLPLELVAMKGDRSDKYVGYVLESDEVWTTVLTETRNIATLNTEDIESRTYCAEEELTRLADPFVPRGLGTERVDCTEITEARARGANPIP